MLTKPGIGLYVLDISVITSRVSFGTYIGMFGARSVLTQAFSGVLGKQKSRFRGILSDSFGGERGYVTLFSVS